MIEKIKKQILESAVVKENMAEACVADMEAAAIIMIGCIKNTRGNAYKSRGWLIACITASATAKSITSFIPQIMALI